MPHWDPKDEPRKDITPASWWVWCCWLQKGMSGHLIYGCAAPSSREPGWHKNDSLDLAASGQLEIRQRTLPDREFNAFQDRLNAGSIALELLAGPDAPSAAIMATRVILQQALGQGAARVTAHYSLAGRTEAIPYRSRIATPYHLRFAAADRPLRSRDARNLPDT